MSSCLLKFLNSGMDTIAVATSARGIVDHTPLIPIMSGIVSKKTTTKIRDLQNETRADMPPLPMAVK